VIAPENRSHDSYNTVGRTRRDYARRYNSKQLSRYKMLNASYKRS